MASKSRSSGARATTASFVVVFDAGTNTSFGLSVERGAALDAFYHPYAYAAFRGIAYQELGARGRGPLERST